MKVIINSKQEQLAEGVSVAELLALRKIRVEMVSVELNGAILHRSKFGTTQLSEGDKVEFLYYMGGGSRVYGERCQATSNKRQATSVSLVACLLSLTCTVRN